MNKIYVYLKSLEDFFFLFTYSIVDVLVKLRISLDLRNIAIRDPVFLYSKNGPAILQMLDKAENDRIQIPGRLPSTQAV